MVQLRSLGSLIFVFFLSIQLYAQDPAFTHFHFTKNELNPAYAGYSRDINLAVNQRVQWLSQARTQPFNTLHAALNVGCENAKLGLALYALRNVEGAGFLATTEAGFQIARYWPFGYKSRGTNRKLNRSVVALGAQAGFGQKTLDWEKLTFSDQLSNTNYRIINQSSAINPQNPATEIRMNLAFGARMMTELSRDHQLSYGASVFHVFSNQSSFFTDNNDIVWPTRYTGHFLYNNKLKKVRKLELSAGGIFNYQASLTSFTAMGYSSYNSMVKMGVGYRGTGNGLPDAIIFQTTFRGTKLGGNNEWLVSATYEITTLTSVGQQRSGGTLEIGFSILFDNSSLCGVGSRESCFETGKGFRKHTIWGY